MRKLLTTTALSLLMVPSLAWADLLNPMTLTMAQITGLIQGLQALNTGSAEQCGPNGPPKPLPPINPKDTTIPPPQTVCPFMKSGELRIAMARNIVALQAPQQEFAKEQDDLRNQVVNDPKWAKEKEKLYAEIPPKDSVGRPLIQEQITNQRAIKDQQLLQAQNVEYGPQFQKLLQQSEKVYNLQEIQLEWLNVGDKPGQNRIDAMTLAQLAPLIPEMQHPMIGSAPHIAPPIPGSSLLTSPIPTTNPLRLPQSIPGKPPITR
jgi:hypothetical protein